MTVQVRVRHELKEMVLPPGTTAGSLLEQVVDETPIVAGGTVFVDGRAASDDQVIGRAQQLEVVGRALRKG